jgi:hypothetical protein
MDSDRGFEGVMFGNWLDFFRGTRSVSGKVLFGTDVLPFLQGPISFRDGTGKSIYLIISGIELLETTFDQQYAFDFQISTVPASPGVRPPVGRRTRADLTSLSIPYDTTRAGRATFGYTFTSLNTLEQNQKNLRDFVLHQWEEGDADPLLNGSP